MIDNWLQDYAFRTGIGWWFFVIPLILIVAVTFLTIVFQVIRIASSNPVNSLRYE